MYSILNLDNFSVQSQIKVPIIIIIIINYLYLSPHLSLIGGVGSYTYVYVYYYYVFFQCTLMYVLLAMTCCINLIRKCLTPPPLFC